VNGRFILASILLTLAVPSVEGRQSHEFDLSRLSERGREAYSRLQTAIIFRIGPVGFAAQTSSEELALQELMSEGEAIGALKSLCRNATTVGSLYALLGLSSRDVNAFREQVQLYRSRSDEDRRRTEDLEKRSQRFPGLVTPTGEVPVQNGCIVMQEQIEAILNLIEQGGYHLGTYGSLNTRQPSPPR